MTDRVADLTWRRPKAVLIVIGIFVVVAGILGRGLEDHLKAAGLHRPRFGERSGRPSCSARDWATTRIRDSSSWRATRTTSASISRRTPVRREVHSLVDDLRGVDFIGRAVDPLRPLERAEDKIRRCAALGDRNRSPRLTTARSRSSRLSPPRSGRSRRRSPRSSRHRRRSSTSNSTRSSRRQQRTSGRKVP